MKEQIKSVRSWSFKGIITVTIFSAMVYTFSASANNKPVVINVAVVEKSAIGVEIPINSIAENSYEAVEEYKAAEFVHADMASEIENWENGNAENNNVSIEAGQYKAAEFVKAEMAQEIECWMNNSL